jgi:hypothetical protein
MNGEHEVIFRNEEFATMWKLREFNKKTRCKVKEAEANLRRELNSLKKASAL